MEKEDDKIRKIVETKGGYPLPFFVSSFKNPMKQNKTCTLLCTGFLVPLAGTAALRLVCLPTVPLRSRCPSAHLVR